MISNMGKRIVLPRYAASQEDAVENVIQLQDMPPPDPAALKPNEVIVAVKSAAISFVDLLMLSGQYQHMVPLPCTPGMEYAGVVTAAGKDARFKVGDTVLSDIMLTGPRSKGDYQANGGWASFAVAPDHALHAIPKGFSFDQACNFLYGYETAYYAFMNRGKLQPGETVLINGASGSTGMAAVQMAKLLGAQVIATGRSKEKLALVKAFGADHVIETSDPGSPGGVRKFRDEVKALTGGEGAHIVFDTVGGALAIECLRSLRFAGRHLIIGWAGNTNVAKGHGQRGSDGADQFPTNLIQMKGLYVMGSPMAIHAQRDPSTRTERMLRLKEWAAEGKITPYVSKVASLQNFRDAMWARLKGSAVGGCVLNP
jgi:NADPH2:quinone reductase